MQTFLNKIRIVIRDSELRKKILFVFLVLVLFRLGANIPIPGIDPLRLADFLKNNQFFGMLNIFSGGGLTNLSIVMLGVGPYITATIIMQLLTMIFPKLKEMYQEDGEIGRKKFEQLCRYITIPLAILQGMALLSMLANQHIFIDITWFGRIVNVSIITAGSVLLMWLGELISEYGIGNGVSLLIFAGIVSRIPNVIGQALMDFNIGNLPMYLGMAAVALVVLAGVIMITEVERLIPVSYAKQVRGSKMYGGVSTHIPLKVNQAGVIPIIFAMSILLFPQMIYGFLKGYSGTIAVIFTKILGVFVAGTWAYGILYFVLVFFFTYFYTTVTFDPQALSDNLQKSGAFIPGIRPGRPTAEYISKILSRITLVGALFLGIVAILPLLMQAFTDNPSLSIGGTALLIVVSVVLETIREIESQITIREYE